MMLLKIVALGATSLLGAALAAAMPTPTTADEPPPPHKAKKKEPGGPGGDLKKTYDLLRRVRSDGRNTGRPEERLRDWTERATKLYRDAIKAEEKGQDRLAREYGAAAHDLARAVDHSRNAASFDLDNDLPPPPAVGGPEGEDERTRRDLRHAYDRIADLRDEAGGQDGKFYLDAAKDLYNAARRDAVAARRERAGELARAAEALTHVPEHLARAADPEDRPEPKEKREKKERRDRPEPPKAKRDRPEAKEKPEPKEKREAKEKPEPKEKRERPGAEGEIPPPIE